ncbi:hypothetical protein LCGC14_2317320, partial [marine sediment metagenome]
MGNILHTADPPADWAATSFDDRAWPRLRGPFVGGDLGRVDKYYGAGQAMICVRGKFGVTDPAGVKRLLLSARYTGGIVVYLNGKEVFRGHLPAGRITAAAQAEAYPKEAYVGAGGKLLARVARTDTEGRRRLGLRTGRRTGPVAIAPTLLRKGVNVLGVAVYRSALRPEAISAAKKRVHWPHIGLHSVRLVAEGNGATPNVDRPAGVQVWNADPHRPLSVADYGDPNEPPSPIRLVSPRNGLASGQVVVSSTSRIRGLRASASELVRSGGGRISAARLTVRYAVGGALDGAIRRTGLGLDYPRWVRLSIFAALADAPPEEVKPEALKTRPAARAAIGLAPRMTPAAVQPVWVTANVPRDVPAGVYRGTLTIRADGIAETKVPVELTAADWTLPDTRDFRTVVSLYQSAETVAAHYKVPMWSARHMALMDRSWRLAGMLGNNTLMVPLVGQTMFGNDESWVPWIKADGGGYTYDFSGRPSGTTAADWENRPVNFVSWGDAARFANWLHNGQPTGILTGDPVLDAG